LIRIDPKNKNKFIFADFFSKIFLNNFNTGEISIKGLTKNVWFKILKSILNLLSSWGEVEVTL